MKTVNFKLTAKVGDEIIPECLNPREFELWAIPFHFEEPVMIGKSHNIVNLIGMISRREQKIISDAMNEEEQKDANYEWKDQWIVPTSPTRIKEVFGDINQAVVEEVVRLVSSNVIVAAFDIDCDESDTYIVIQKEATEICVIKVDHCRGYEGTNVEMYLIDRDGETLEDFIKKYNKGEFEKYFSNGKIILAESGNFGFHESDYGNGYVYDTCNDDIHFVIM